jgi:hypothetical protein
MSNNMLTKNPVEINGQFSTNPDQPLVLLAKLKALLEFGLNGNLEIHTAANIHNYLCVVSDLVEQLEAAMA